MGWQGMNDKTATATHQIDVMVRDIREKVIMVHGMVTRGQSPIKVQVNLEFINDDVDEVLKQLDRIRQS